MTELLELFETALRKMRGRGRITIHWTAANGDSFPFQEFSVSDINITPTETGTLKGTAPLVKSPGKVEFEIKNPKEDVSEKLKKLMRSASGIDKKDSD